MHLFRLPLPEILLRIGIAFAFLYPPVAALTDPESWLGYFPAFLTTLAGSHELLLLHVFGVVEVALALWILFGKRVFIPSVIACGMLLAIVVFNLAQFPVLFRDISIALMAATLAVMHYKKNGSST